MRCFHPKSLCGQVSVFLSSARSALSLYQQTLNRCSWWCCICQRSSSIFFPVARRHWRHMIVCRADISVALAEVNLPIPEPLSLLWRRNGSFWTWPTCFQHASSSIVRVWQHSTDRVGKRGMSTLIWRGAEKPGFGMRLAKTEGDIKRERQVRCSFVRWSQSSAFTHSGVFIKTSAHALLGEIHI